MDGLNSIQGFRVSPQQERLWTFGENNSSICSQCSVTLKGTLNFTKLQFAVQKLIQKHEALRTTFKQLQGMEIPLQIIHEELSPKWMQLDLKKENQAENTKTLEALYLKERMTPFDLENGPLIRLNVIFLTEEQTKLLITISALCADTLSLQNIVKEIGEAYGTSTDFEEVEEPLQYIQFSEWKNDIYEEEAEEGIAFWENQNWENTMKLKLPWSEASKNIPINMPNIVSTTLLRDQCIELGDIAENWGLTLEDLCFSSWHLFMWYLTGQSEIVTGYVFDGRKYEEMEETVGLLANPAPVGYKIIANTRLDEVLQGIGESQYKAYQWQEYFSFRNYQAHHPYFSSGFEYVPFMEMPSVEGLDFEIETLIVTADFFDIKMVCSKLEDESLKFDLYYTNPHWGKEYVKELLQSYIKLVQSCIDQSKISIAALDILSVGMKRKLLEEREIGSVESRRFSAESFHILFEEQANRTPDHVALIFEDQQLTYRELNEQANKLAHALLREGVELENKVGICMERSVHMIVALLGVLKVGGTYVPIDTGFPVERKQFILEDSKVSLLLTQEHLLPTIKSIKTPMICLDRESNRIQSESKSNLDRFVKNDSSAYVIYTSGSTGKPKGVVVEHRQIINYLNGMHDRFSLGDSASYATVSTLAADLGNTVIYMSLCTGGSLHIIGQERLLDAKKLAEYFITHSIDCLKIVPSHLSTLLSSSQAVHIFPKRLLILGGESLSWDLVGRVQKLDSKCEIINHYGPTETTIGVTTYKVNVDAGNFASSTVPIGKPIANTHVYIMNPYQQLTPFGVSGELYIGGDSLSRGYLDNPELTAKHFVLNPLNGKEVLYRTGDIVRYLPEGNLEFLERTDDQVKIRGYRVEIEELRYVLEKHASIKEAFILPFAEDEEKQLIAYLVASSDQEPSKDELSEFIKATLPDYFIPSFFVFLKQFPLTVNGKIDRQSLPDPVSQDVESKIPIVYPETYTQDWLANIWKKLLGIDEISIHAKFFEIGGNSLKSINLLSSIQEDYEYITLVDLFDHNTIASLSAFIEKREGQKKTEDIIENFEL
ncbi:hypothetical protein GCM10008014_15500 [Paenibacillus silvae]|uniref:Carrier domain-containing protein n=1 Tax=Paenibacillus silvae TaxID=1325358 RepID=A0ABQ1Z841_9BACL|nr:non-ribosomal peptide synthetase [Paenibacillus silvae]GGH50409.1 hypothetical protein GCM10008014_15500 [Paenibacillus silvae]